MGRTRTPPRFDAVQIPEKSFSIDDPVSSPVSDILGRWPSIPLAAGTDHDVKEVATISCSNTTRRRRGKQSQIEESGGGKIIDGGTSAKGSARSGAQARPRQLRVRDENMRARRELQRSPSWLLGPASTHPQRRLYAEKRRRVVPRLLREHPELQLVLNPEGSVPRPERRLLTCRASGGRSADRCLVAPSKSVGCGRCGGCWSCNREIFSPRRRSRTARVYSRLMLVVVAQLVLAPSAPIREREVGRYKRPLLPIGSQLEFRFRFRLRR
jgi:hypothetical protein